MPDILLEICCGSADDAVEAARGGADRVELNSNLFQGGLTPTAGTLQVVKEQTEIPVMAMIRPRAGGFCYTDNEFAAARADARILLDHGVKVIQGDAVARPMRLIDLALTNIKPVPKVKKDGENK